MLELPATYEEKIRILTHEYLTGIISDQDKTELIREIQRNNDAMKICRDTCSAFEKVEKLNSALKWKKKLTLPEDLRQKIDEADRRRISRKRTIKTLLAAAIVTGVVLGTTLSYFRAQNQLPATKVVSLTLASGKQIPLPAKDATLNAEDITLNNNNGSLTYKGGKGASINALHNLNKLTVPPGLNYQLILSDGTKIWLNSATTLNFPFSFPTDNREIAIDGEAYLEVAPDPARPFICHLPAGKTVQVLGTSFNVNTYAANIAQVALVSGAVHISLPNGKKARLTPGYLAIAQNDELETEKYDAETLLSWRQGEYYFEKTKLKDVASVIARWYGIEVVIDAEQTGNIPFTGVISRQQPLDKFLFPLHSLLSVDYYYKDGILHIK